LTSFRENKNGRQQKRFKKGQLQVNFLSFDDCPSTENAALSTAQITAANNKSWYFFVCGETPGRTAIKTSEAAHEHFYHSDFLLLDYYRLQV
jgi:hypothetical protein